MRCHASILVIEDEPNLRSTLGMILQSDGYRVTTACHARSVLRGADTDAYDLIFIDVDPVELDAVDLLTTLCRLRPAISVVILTASPERELPGAAGPTRRWTYLVKPIDPIQILNCVRDSLSP